MCEGRRHLRSILTFTLTRIHFHFAPLSAESPQTSPEMILLGGSVQERSLECSGDKKALCSMSVLKSGECQHPIFTLAEAFVMQSGKQLWFGM